MNIKKRCRKNVQNRINFRGQDLCLPDNNGKMKGEKIK